MDRRRARGGTGRARVHERGAHIGLLWTPPPPNESSQQYMGQVIFQAIRNAFDRHAPQFCFNRVMTGAGDECIRRIADEPGKSVGRFSSLFNYYYYYYYYDSLLTEHSIFFKHRYGTGQLRTHSSQKFPRSVATRFLNCSKSVMLRVPSSKPFHNWAATTSYLFLPVTVTALGTCN